MVVEKNLDIDDMLRILPAMMKCRRNPWGEKLQLSWADFGSQWGKLGSD